VVDMVDWVSAVFLRGGGLRFEGKGRKAFDWCCGAYSEARSLENEQLTRKNEKGHRVADG